MARDFASKEHVEAIEDHLVMALQVIVKELLASHPHPGGARIRMAAAYAHEADKYWTGVVLDDDEELRRLDWHLRRMFE